MAPSRLPRDPVRWLWPMACLLTLTGYFGSWVAHPVAGLAILGLDLGEYVKFLPDVISGNVTVWREGFYLPLFAVAIACSLLTYRKEYRYAFWLRLALILLGIVATLNMLPPAWSPAVLRTTEFRLQTLAIAVSLGLLAASPLLTLAPSLLVYAAVAIVSLFAGTLPVVGFLRVLPGIAVLYGHAIAPSWGMYLTVGGMLLLLTSSWLGYRRTVLPASTSK